MSADAVKKVQHPTATGGLFWGGGLFSGAFRPFFSKSSTTPVARTEHTSSCHDEEKKDCSGGIAPHVSDTPPAHESKPASFFSRTMDTLNGLVEERNRFSPKHG